MLKAKILKALSEVSSIPASEIYLELPDSMEHGDYSTNLALQAKGKNPREIAEGFVERLKKDEKLSAIVEKIEVAGPGFINFWLSKDVFIDTLVDINTKKDVFGKSDLLKGKKYLVEHTSPNTIKILHVGHVRNNVLGMSVHNLLEFAGAEVKLDAINNDRGIHVMKAVWAYMKYGEGFKPSSEKPDHFVDKFYVMGAKAYETDEKSKEEMHELLRKWEAGDEEIRMVWRKLRDWTFAGFRDTYKRLSSYHDYQWFESDFYEHGKEVVEEGLKKGIFRKLEDGAVLSNLEKYGLSDTIVLRADGTSMYHTQDLYLTKLKREKFPSDLYIWDIGPEQELYLKQLFAMCEQLGIGKRQNYYHMSYGFVYLKGGGKMSSRAGNVVSADELIDSVVSKAKEIIEKSKISRGLSEDEKNKVSEAVGFGAIKYGFLKVGRTTDIYFDIDESLALEGNSGPYLQYTYARTQSVLRNFKTQNSKLKTTAKNLKLNKLLDLSFSFDISDLTFELNEEELTLLRTFIHFPEIVEEVAKNYSPNLVCNYLYDLAQKFNLFYARHRILDVDSERSENEALRGQKHRILEGVDGGNSPTTIFRLSLTFATGQILKNGLNLLGIQAPERM